MIKSRVQLFFTLPSSVSFSQTLGEKKSPESPCPHYHMRRLMHSPENYSAFTAIKSVSLFLTDTWGEKESRNLLSLYCKEVHVLTIT